MSARFRIFAFAIGVLFLVNLLLWNEASSLWSGGESALWWYSHLVTNEAGLPGWWVSQLQLVPSEIAQARWLSGGLLLVTLVLFNTLGQKVFKRERVILGLLVMTSSLLLPNFGKLASADMYLFFAQFGGFLCLILYLKQPLRFWQVTTYLFLCLGLALHPLSTLIFWAVLSLWLWRRHPAGQQLSKLYLWGVAPLMGLVLWLIGSLSWQPMGYVFSVNQLPLGRFLLFSLVGMAPFLGYLFGGLRDNAMLLRKGEEQAVIYTGGLIAGFLAFSISWQAFLALLVAKQMEVYFKDNYPFRDWVKTGALVHLVLVFAFAFALLYNGFIYFEGDGYRASMAMTGAYWALSFVGVIGLYGIRRSLALGATLLSGLVGMLFFWLQLHPLLETQRSLVQETPKEIQQKSLDASQLYILPKHPSQFPNVAVYSKSTFDSVRVVQEENTFTKAIGGPNKVGLTSEYVLPYTPEGKSIDTLSTRRWSDWMVPGAWLMIKEVN